jgi:hypothetical protein
VRALLLVLVGMAAIADAEDLWPELPGTPINIEDPDTQDLPDAVLKAAAARGYRGDTGVRFRAWWFLPSRPLQDDPGVGLYDADGKLLWEPDTDPAIVQWRVTDAGTDVTGDGIPDLHLRSWTGAPACCFGHLLLDGAHPQQVHEVDQGEGEPTRFRKLDGRPVLFVPQTLAKYRWGASAAAPAVWPAWSWQQGALRFDAAATRLAHRAPIDAAELRRQLEDEARTRRGSNTDSAARNDLLAAVALAVVGGRTEEARTLIDRVWPAGLAGEAGFRCIAVYELAVVDNTGELTRLHGEPLHQLLDAPRRCRRSEDGR